MKEHWIGSENHRVRVSEIDAFKQATLPALINLMQEVAWNNSANLKYSVYDLMQHGVTWVVYRMQVHIYRYPSQQELLSVRSWPSGMDRLYTYRDYDIKDEAGEVIVRATSAWLVMDIKKRELVSVPGFIREGLDFSQDYERLELDRTKLKPVSSSQSNYQTEVGLFHMDVNGHVNNAYYFQWLLETVRNKLTEGNRVNYIDIMFKGESKVRDIIKASTEKISANQYLHQIFNQGTNNELIRAQTKWDSSE